MSLNFLSPHLWKAPNPKKVTVRSPERKFPRQQRNLLKKSTDDVDDDDDDVDCFDLRKIFLESPSQVQTKNVYKKKYLLRHSRIFFLTIFTFEICTTVLKIPTSLLKKVHYYINNSKYLPRLFSSRAMLTIQVQ